MKRTLAPLMPLLVLMTAAALGRQTPAPSRQDPPPTFRLAVNFVQIDAVVTDAQGRFVRGLTKDDFELIEGETPQTISAFTVVDVPVVKSEPRAGGGAPIEPDVRTNLGPLDGRLFVIVLDDLQTDFKETVQVRRSAKDFVRRFVGANDLVAVVHTGTGGRNAQDFTSSPARLSAAIDKFAGAKDLGPGPPLDPLFNARNALSALRSVARVLGKVQDRRKAVVWFSAGVTTTDDDGVSVAGGDSFAREVNDTIDVARRAGVAFYAVDPRGLATGVSSAATAIDSESGNPYAATIREQRFLRRMSEETGGFAIVDHNAPEELFPRLIEENSRYYLLGYYPTNGDRDGTFRPVQVRVKRRGLHVRARAGYTAAAAASDGAAAPLEQALYSPLPVSDLGLRVVASPFAGSSRTAAIAIAVELTPDRLNFVEKAGVHTEQIELVCLLMDAAGKPHPGIRNVAAIRVPSANLQEMKQQGVRLARRVDLPPGRYQLRVAARAVNSGAVGAVTYDLDVPDFSKRAFAMSGIALMSAATARMPTPAPAQDLLEIVPDVPTATRSFNPRDTLGVFAEIYDRRAKPSDRVTVTTTVTNVAGKVVTSSAVERESGQLAREKGRLAYATSVPLANLSRGRYVLRVEARSSGAGERVARETEFWVQ